MDEDSGLVSCKKDEYNGAVRVGGILGEIRLQDRGGLFSGEAGCNVQGDHAQHNQRTEDVGER